MVQELFINLRPPTGVTNNIPTPSYNCSFNPELVDISIYYKMHGITVRVCIMMSEYHWLALLVVLIDKPLFIFRCNSFVGMLYMRPGAQAINLESPGCRDVRFIKAFNNESLTYSPKIS